MKPEVRAAFFEWVAGLIIGVTPLLAHGILHVFADPAHQWEDSWAGDVLFVSITTSGLSAVTVFTRLAKGVLTVPLLGPSSCVIMAVTLVLFLLAGMLYGVVASGHAREITIWPAVVFLLCSGTASLYFELTLAAAMPKASGTATV
jgi:hypothetical protein